MYLLTSGHHHDDEEGDTPGDEAVAEGSESVEGGVGPPDVGVGGHLHRAGQQEVHVGVATQPRRVQRQPVVHERVRKPE